MSLVAQEAIKFCFLLWYTAMPVGFVEGFELIELFLPSLLLFLPDVVTPAKANAVKPLPVFSAYPIFSLP
jgi:hypothetical protein